MRLFLLAVAIGFFLTPAAMASDWYCGGVPWQITPIPYGYAIDHGNRALYCTNIRYNSDNVLQNYGDAYECSGGGYSKLTITHDNEKIIVKYPDTGKKTILTSAACDE